MKISCVVFMVAVLCCAVNAAPQKRSAYGGYGKKTVVSAPAPVAPVAAPVVQMDNSYGSKTLPVAPVAAPVVHMDNSYGSKTLPVAPVAAPVVQMEHSYGAGSNIMFDRPVSVAVEITDPALINMCKEKRTDNTVFYLPHPTIKTSFIQCDLFGKTYLKQCPEGTIFTLNLVCENPEDLHPIGMKTVAKPVLQMDQSYGSYGAAPAFTAPQTNVVEVSRVEVLREAPEFRELCLTKSSSYGSAIFYVAHPTDERLFIQCDEFGKAWLKECPRETIFSIHMVCERRDEIIVEKPVVQMEQHQGSYDSYGAGSSYGSETSYGSKSTYSTGLLQDIPVHTVETIREAPEFRDLCLSKNAYGAQTSQLFYIQHPTNKNMFIQCDEFGMAFLKQCPMNTIFTGNHVCEDINDLHEVVERPIAKPALQMDQSYGSYGAAPSFGLGEGVQENYAKVEVVQEAPEYKQLCLSHNSYGTQVSTLFYIPHPTNKNMYIQCNEFGTAYLKTCPVGTIFTRRLTCENIDEIIEEEPIALERPAVHAETYGAYSAPVVTEAYSAPAPVVTEAYSAPVVTEAYSAPVVTEAYSAPVVTEAYSAPVVTEAYSAPAPVVTQPIMRDIPVMTHQSNGY